MDPDVHKAGKFFSAETGETKPVALGRLFATRSGDKWGNANLGV